jgi:hypothetical protein
MTKAKRDRKLEEELAGLVAERFPGVDIHVEHSDRWQRMSVTFRWAGFANLLPEERFHRLQSVIPDGFREQKLTGFVWLELAEGETIDGFLKLPRSEDVAEREAELYEKMTASDFFGGLKKALGKPAMKSCPGDLSTSAGVLKKAGWSKGDVEAGKLVFIRHGAYCDCQVLESVGPALMENYGA